MLPMDYSTQDSFNPKESTLLIIKQIAYAYNAVTQKNISSETTFCFN